MTAHNLHRQVLPDRPKIEVKLTRDSVCAGDDSDAPHERLVEAYSFVDPDAFVEQFWTGYLPSVNGVGHSWTVSLNGKAIALITTSKIETMVASIDFEDANVIHFEYHSAAY
jgi:hypothetical protein